MALRVMVTGCYGLIAGAVYRHLDSQPDRFTAFGCARREAPSVRAPADITFTVPKERYFRADLSDYDSMRRAVDGMDVVVQMAAEPNEAAPFEKILNSNVVGAYNVFEACCDAGVGRVVYASSVMASWGYQADEPYRAIREGRLDDVPADFHRLTHLDPPRPTEPYSASKVWGEALARTYSDVHGMSCLCVRIGWVNAEDRPYKPALLPVWCSQRDILDLVERCVLAPDDLRFDLYYGVSDNDYRWVDTEHAKKMVGFQPRDRGEEWVQPNDG